MSYLRSDMHISSWRGDLTFFPSQYVTAPVKEAHAVGWDQVVDAIAPSSGAFVVSDKQQLPYFIASSLATAQLVGKTLAANLAKGGNGYGRQRSKNHVTQTRLLTFDIDHVDIEVMSDTVRTLEHCDISYLMYTTYSHGNHDEVRLRFVIPIVESLDIDGYQCAHDWFNDALFQGLADKSGNRLYQCQGVWGCPPDRIHLARRRLFNAGVLCVPSIARHIHNSRNVEPTQAPPTDDTSLQTIREIYDCSPAMEILKRLGFSRKVRDGEGREAAVLKLAGRLRARGFSDEQIIRLCRVWNSQFCFPPLDDELVIDRCSRYCHADNHFFCRADTFARDLAAELLARDIKRQGLLLVMDDKRVCFDYLRSQHPERCLGLGFAVAVELEGINE